MFDALALSGQTIRHECVTTRVALKPRKGHRRAAPDGRRDEQLDSGRPVPAKGGINLRQQLGTVAELGIEPQHDTLLLGLSTGW